MKNTNKDLASIKREFDAIVAYEKKRNTPMLSATNILKYFGADTICEIYGCTIVTHNIAYCILTEVLRS